MEPARRRRERDVQFIGGPQPVQLVEAEPPPLQQQQRQRPNRRRRRRRVTATLISETLKRARTQAKNDLKEARKLIKRVNRTNKEIAKCRGRGANQATQWRISRRIPEAGQ